MIRVIEDPEGRAVGLAEPDAVAPGGFRVVEYERRVTGSHYATIRHMAQYYSIIAGIALQRAHGAGVLEPLFAGRADGFQQAAEALGQLLKNWGQPYDPVTLGHQAARAALDLSEDSANVFVEALAVLGALPKPERALVAGLVAGALANE